MAATSVLIPVEEYLRTTYHPDCDYINGEVLERNMGELLHGGLHGFLHTFSEFTKTSGALLPFLKPASKWPPGITAYRISWSSPYPTPTHAS